MVMLILSTIVTAAVLEVYYLCCNSVTSKTYVCLQTVECRIKHHGLRMILPQEFSNFRILTVILYHIVHISFTSNMAAWFFAQFNYATAPHILTNIYDTKTLTSKPRL